MESSRSRESSRSSRYNKYVSLYKLTTLAFSLNGVVAITQRTRTLTVSSYDTAQAVCGQAQSRRNPCGCSRAGEHRRSAGSLRAKHGATQQQPAASTSTAAATPAPANSAFKTANPSPFLSASPVSDPYPISQMPSVTAQGPVQWQPAQQGRPSLTGGIPSGRVTGASHHRGLCMRKRRTFVAVKARRHRSRSPKTRRCSRSMTTAHGGRILLVTRACGGQYRTLCRASTRTSRLNRKWKMYVYCPCILVARIGVLTIRI